MLVELNVFFIGRKLKTITDFKINCIGHLTKSKSCIKYSGIDIDHNFLMTEQSTPLLKQVNYRMIFMNRKTNVLSPETKRTLSMTLMQCNFDYSYSYWNAGVS